MFRFLFFICFTFLIGSPSLSAQIMINEFSAANKSDVTDNFGEYEDWIELYNAGSSPVNITGYYLSDKNSNPLKWQIPAATIAAGGTMIFYASGLDGVFVGNFHTNFKITQTKQEWVVLSDAAGNLIDNYQIVNPMQENHSIGRQTNGATAWVYFTNPTVNSANSGIYYTSYEPKPLYTLSPGFYTGTQTVGFTVPSGSTVYYTTDGSVPTNSSTSYSTPISLPITTIIRAVAYSSTTGIGPSFNENNSYFIDDSHTLPVISVAGDFSSLFLTGTEIKNSYEFFGVDQILKFELEGDTRRHGNDSWAYPQKGMRFYARDDYGYENRMEYEFFPNTNRDKFKVLIMKAAGSDNYPFGAGGNSSAHMRDGIVQSVAIKSNMSVDCRSYENAIIYINGEYWGVYELRERVDDDYCKIYYNQDDANDEVNMLEYWGSLDIEYGTDATWNSAYTYIISNNLTVPANYTQACNLIDKESFIDYFIINTFFVNSDWLNWNTKWWEGTGGTGVKWRYTLWDMDNTFDLGQNYTGLPTTGVYANPCDVQSLFPNNPNIPHVAIFNKLFDNNDFFEDYINRYADLMNTDMHKDSINDFIDEVYAKLLPEMTDHTVRWGGSVPDWTLNVDALKNFTNTRWDTVMGSLVDCYSTQLTGIYDLRLEVVPYSAGEIQVNSVVPSNYPWSGTYFGGLNLDFKALANTGYVFDHWEAGSMVISPNMTDDEINSILTSDDTLRAVFVGNQTLTVLVEPVNTGTVEINGTAISTYPWINNYTMNSLIDLKASPLPYHRFVGWESQMGTSLNPSSLDSTINMNLLQADILTAKFEAIEYPLIIDCDPPAAASIWVDGIQELAGVFPYQLDREWGEGISLTVEYDTSEYEFLGWQSLQATLLPNPLSTSVNFSSGTADNVTAFFKKRVNTVFVVIPGNTGELVINGSKQTNFPYQTSFSQGDKVIIYAEPNVDYKFSKWRSAFNFLDNPSYEALNYITTNLSDTVFAYFEQLDLNPQFPNIIHAGGPEEANSKFLIPIDPSLILGFELSIYDRWGKRIFHSKAPEDTWDGTFNGDYVPTDSYIYEIEFISKISNRERRFQGSITVIR